MPPCAHVLDAPEPSAQPLSCFAAGAGLTGGSLLLDCFLMAFALPNLLRNLFGEGALSAAFIPRYVQLKDKDPVAAERFAGAVLTRLAIGLTFLITDYVAKPFRMEELLARLRTGDGKALPAMLLARLRREWDRLQFASGQVKRLDADRFHRIGIGGVPQGGERIIEWWKQRGRDPRDVERYNARVGDMTAHTGCVAPIPGPAAMTRTTPTNDRMAPPAGRSVMPTTGILELTILSIAGTSRSMCPQVRSTSSGIRPRASNQRRNII